MKVFREKLQICGKLCNIVDDAIEIWKYNVGILKKYEEKISFRVKIEKFVKKRVLKNSCVNI